MDASNDRVNSNVDVDASLSAWLDGQLSSEESTAFEERMSRNPELSAAAAAFKQQDRLLREWYASTSTRELPSTKRWRLWYAIPAATAALLLAGILIFLLAQIKGDPANTAADKHLHPDLNGAIAKVAVYTSEAVIERGKQILHALNIDELNNGDLVRTGNGGHLWFQFLNETTTIDARMDTDLKISATELGKRLELLRGTIQADVALQPPGKSMILTTPEAEVMVVGTKFMLSSDRKSTRLEVTEGKIRLKSLLNQETIDVVGGQFAVVSKESDLLAHPMASK